MLEKGFSKGVDDTIRKTYDNGFYQMFKMYCGNYKSDPAKFVFFWKRVDVPVIIMYDYYDKMVREGLKPFEEILPGEQNAIKEECEGASKFDKLCRGIYAVKEFNKDTKWQEAVQSSP